MQTAVSSGRGHPDFSAIEAARLKLIAAEQFGLLCFKDAAEVWLAEHRRDISDATCNNYEHMLIPLTEAFGDRPLNEIDAADVEGYQIWRQKPWFDERSQRTFRAGYSPINHECSMLRQILDRAGLWTKKIAGFYKPLKQPKTRAGHALEPEERARLLAVAKGNPYWTVAYHATMLTLNTTAGAGEIRHLHLGDVDLERMELTIRDGLKNEHRDRVVPLNESAAESLVALRVRAERLGCTDREHYLLPHQAHRRGEPFDPNRPMLSWKRAWQAMRAKAGLPRVRANDLRHDAITRLPENPQNSEQTVLELAGHVTKKMQSHYSHIHMDPKREAVKAAEVKAPADLAQAKGVQ